MLLTVIHSLTLGGGYGWLMGRHGMAIDNVQQVTLVTAAGEILTVSDDSNPDLFWAIRGGGTNFGVVTEFVYRLHEQAKMVFAGPLVYPPPMISKVVEAMEAIYKKGDPDVGMMLATTTSTPPPPRGSGGPGLVAFVFHNGEAAEANKRFQSLLDLGEPLVPPDITLPIIVPWEMLTCGSVFRPNHEPCWHDPVRGPEWSTKCQHSLWPQLSSRRCLSGAFHDWCNWRKSVQHSHRSGQPT
jgi:hypothetical protein